MNRFRPAVGQGMFDWIQPTPADEPARRGVMWEKIFGTPTLKKEEAHRLVYEGRRSEGGPPRRFGDGRARWGEYARSEYDGRARWEGNGGPAPRVEPRADRGMYSEVTPGLYGNPGREGFSWDLAAVVAVVGIVTVLELSGVTNILGTRA